MQIEAEALATMIEMLIKASEDVKALAKFEFEPTEVKIRVAKDARVPGGIVISATGSKADFLTDRYIDWLQSGDTGTSSEAIFEVMTGKHGKYAGSDDNWPHDVSDLGRCVRLLDRFPDWRGRMNEVIKRFPGWGPLVSIWPELEAVYQEEIKNNERGMARKTYAMISSLHERCMLAAGWTKEGPGSWNKKS